MQRLTGNQHFRYYRLAYSVFATVTLLAVLTYQFSIESRLLFRPSLPVVVGGVIFTAIGMGIMGACIKKYFFNLSGVDVLTKQISRPVLEEKGMHAYVRHPLYAGTLLFIWSLFFIFPFVNHLVACSIVTVYTIVGIVLEERKLLVEFGESYKKYSQRIPMLIPSSGTLWKNK